MARFLRSNLRYSLIVPIVALCAVWGVSTPVRACSCIVPPPPTTALAQSHAVFSGIVLSFERFGDFQRRATFEVTAVWKGPLAETIELVTAFDEATCGRDFTVGVEYLVFALEANGMLTDNLCSRTNVFVAAEAEQLGAPCAEGPDVALREGEVCGPPAGTPFFRSDANDDGRLELADATTILTFLFLGADPAPPCQKALDTDDSGAVDLSDAVFLLGFLFLGGDLPPDPFVFPGELSSPWFCGFDPTEDDLTCTEYTSCGSFGF
jgi:hypothetical protein